MAESEVTLVSVDNEEFIIKDSKFRISSSTVKGNVLIMIDEEDGPEIYEVNERYFHSKVVI